MLAFEQHYDVTQPLAVLAAMVPTLIATHLRKQCHVILHGEGRGMVVVDWRNRVKLKYAVEGAVTIVTAFERTGVLAVLHEVVKEDCASINALLKQH